MDAWSTSLQVGMNLHNQILTIALSSLKAAAASVGFQSSANSGPTGQEDSPTTASNSVPEGIDTPTPLVCPMISESGVVRPVDCTPVELLPIISMETVAEHDDEDDCWIILYDLVYDLTDFIREHPGGSEVLLEHAGRDGTLAFAGVGHTKQALLSMDKMVIGVLPEEERLYLKPTSSSIWDSLSFISPGLIELQSEAEL